MVYEFVRILKERSQPIIPAYIGGTKENHDKPHSVRIAGDPAQIRTKHFQI
jgi:hypothetical protein